MAYKNSKTRVELFTQIIERNKTLDTPYGDFCGDTASALRNSGLTENQLEELLASNLEDLFGILSKGNMCYEAEKQMKIFITRFKRYCESFNL